MHFDGIDDRNAAEALTGSPAGAEPLDDDDDALWVHDLIGAGWSTPTASSAARASRCSTTRRTTSSSSTPALVPVIFVVSCAGGMVIVDPPDGLFDLSLGH